MKFNLLLLFTTLTAFSFTLTLGARIQLLDITPEEAQKHITQQSLDLRYSKKLSEGPAAGRSYNGKIIDSDDYTEEVYEANQFHGQDGLGRFIFGYGDNQQARLEARNVNGEVRGQYRYLDPFGNDIEVQYWSDSLGYHQTDNRPQYDLQPVTETPEVQKAREEHERAWKEAARLNGIDVDSNGLYHDTTDVDDDELEGQLSNQNVVRFPILPYSKHISTENAEDFGRVEDDSVIVDAAESKPDKIHSRIARQQGIDEDVTSEPRGFFYSFDYPVPFINDRSARSQFHQQQASDIVESYVHAEDANKNDNYNKNTGNEIKEVQTKKIKTTTAATAVEEDVKQKSDSENIRRSGPIPAEEIHDVQQQPKQKVNRSVQRGRGSIKFKHTI